MNIKDFSKNLSKSISLMTKTLNSINTKNLSKKAKLVFKWDFLESAVTDYETDLGMTCHIVYKLKKDIVLYDHSIHNLESLFNEHKIYDIKIQKDIVKTCEVFKDNEKLIRLLLQELCGHYLYHIITISNKGIKIIGNKKLKVLLW